VGALFQEPTLPPIVRGLSVSFVFTGWSITGLGQLRPHLRFRALSLVAVVSYVFAYLVVGVGMALLGAGVWSLVAASVTSTAVQSILQYALLRHPVRPVLRWEPYRAVCGYGARLASAYLIDYIGGNLGTFAVTRIASAAVVGQYSRAYYLVFQPLGNYLAQGLINVLFSTLSRIQQDLARLRGAFLSVLSITSVVLFPVCAGMSVAAQELAAVVLGPQWTLVPGLVPWFAVAGGCNVASRMTQLLAEARAELNRSLAVQVIYLVALALLLLAAVFFKDHGVWVIGAAVAGAEVLRYIGYLLLARRILRLASGQVWRAHLPAAFASAGVALAVAAVRAPLTGHAPAILILAAEMFVGALALALCIRLCPLPAIRRELSLRLDAADLLGAAGGLRWRLARLVLGPEAPAAKEGNP
jgi:lipopolysaccharide exporter